MKTSGDLTAERPGSAEVSFAELQQCLDALEAGDTPLLQGSPEQLAKYPHIAEAADRALSLDLPRDESLQYLVSAKRRKPLPRIERAPSAAFSPLTFTQIRWAEVDHLGYPEGRLPIFMRFRGRLNVRAMRMSFAFLIRKHAALRSTFQRVDGEWRQTWGEYGPELEVLDLPPGDTEEREEWLYNHETERRKAEGGIFGPVMRISLYVGGDRTWYIAGSASHIVYDADSAQLFWADLFSGYSRAVLGMPLSDEPGLQYADFVWWERKLFTRAQQAAAFLYWTLALDGYAPPRFKPATPFERFRRPMDKTPMNFEGEDFRALTAFVRDRKLSLNTMLLAAIAAVAGRLSGERKVAIGTIVHGRPAGMTRVMGCFAQSRPFPVDLSPDLTFEEYMEAAKRSALASADLRLPIPQSVWARMGLWNVGLNATFLRSKFSEEESRDVLGLLPRGIRMHKPFAVETSRHASFSARCYLDAIDGTLAYGMGELDLTQAEHIVAMIRSFLLEGITQPDERIGVLLSRPVRAAEAAT